MLVLLYCLRFLQLTRLATSSNARVKLQEALWWIEVAANFPGKVLGRFLQNVAAFMNWCHEGAADSLCQPLTTQWWGVGTSQDR
ncbi:hypothetical protein EMIT0P74_130141 [Pseudomonas sp. IT-P74]